MVSMAGIATIGRRTMVTILGDRQGMPRLGAAESTDEAALELALLSPALAPLFRGRFCDVLLANREPLCFAEDEVLYEMGEEERTLFVIREGVVKTGTITSRGREIIYDVRKDGDVCGELCALGPVRRDRAVALVRTQAVRMGFDEVVDVLSRQPLLLRDFTEILCGALADAYAQVNRLAGEDVMQRLVNVLLSLAGKFGQPLGNLVEIETYLTQEELSQMVVARRERVSTALNSLRRRGIVHYSPRGHLLVDMGRLHPGET
jgi:CRP-like cAMP-binding protein